MRSTRPRRTWRIKTRVSVTTLHADMMIVNMMLTDDDDHADGDEDEEEQRLWQSCTR